MRGTDRTGGWAVCQGRIGRPRDGRSLPGVLAARGRWRVLAAVEGGVDANRLGGVTAIDGVSRRTITQRLFGWGRLPWGVRPAIEAEGVFVLDEGDRIDLILWRYRAPGGPSAYRRKLRPRAVVLTGKRFALFGRWGTLFDVSVADRRL